MVGTLPRLALLSIGWLAVSLAVLGVVLPLLPTTPFVLLAAGCFSRTSARCHRWLLAAPLIGPVLDHYQSGCGIAPATRIKAIAWVWVGIGSSLVWVVQATLLRVLLLAIAIAVTVFLWRLGDR